MTERFIGRDPPKGKSIDKLAEYVKGLVGERVKAMQGGLPMVGMGGTIRNLAKVQQKRDNYPLSMLHGYRLRYKDVKSICEDLEDLDFEGRQDVSGLNERRADVIVAAAYVVRPFMEMAEVEALTVSAQGVREGLLAPHMWPHTGGLSPSVRAFSPENVVRRYYPRPKHNHHVRALCEQLFDQLKPWHGYDEPERELLGAAALMHDIGMSVEYFDHHKYSELLVLASPLPGYTHREQAMIALMVGLHRKGKVKTHGMDDLLGEGDEERIGKLSGILRLPEYLERTKAQRVESVTCHLGSDYLQVEVHAPQGARVEVAAANDRSGLLARSFGVKVEVIQGFT